MHHLLLALLIIGLVGMGAELLLLRHTETVWELIPLLLIGWSLVTVAWHGISRGRGSIRALQATMGLFLIAGLAGFALHYQANMEFRLETNPSLSGWTLVWAVLSGKTPPILAPGAMIQLGLLGLVYTYKHPALFLTDVEVQKQEHKMKKSKPRFWLSLAIAILSSSIASEPRAQVGRQQGLTEPNVADENALVKLPHLNPGLVKGILERRPFSNMMELHKFLSPSLDSKELNELYTKMFLQINLNTASREEIMLIPSMGNRMVREFLEYRPYTALTQFRKEIGKYVDDKEVARLEQYVFVPINLNTASDETLSSIPGVSSQVIGALKDSRPYKDMEQFRRDIAKSVDAKEAARLERYFVIN